MNLSRLLRTVWHLRPVQVYGRLWLRLYRPRADRRPAPDLRPRDGTWTEWAWRPALMSGSTTFTFLNVTKELRSPLNWDDPGHQKLWRYNLHYFDDLTARDAAQRSSWHADLIDRWIKDNPPPKGTAWEPYPTSLRIVNWIKWGLPSAFNDKVRLEAPALNNLATQARWLSKRLEIHLLANHLWANAKALVFAGVFFDGHESDRWLTKGLSLLERELGEQVLSDGGHFERSPMYHATVLEDVLDLINLAAAYPSRLPQRVVDRFRWISVRMLRWLRVMSHPDGGISFFNDAAFGIAAGYDQLAKYGERLGIDVDDAPLSAIEALPESGYVRLQNESAVVICDVAPLGPEYLPAHAHADTLSFELSLYGQRVLVNGGTGTYETSRERERQRATASHNTVVVDRQNSSEVWGAFRVARRARPMGVHWANESGALRLTGSHGGYRHLPGKVTHSRTWLLKQGELSVRDGLSGQFESAAALFGLHPDIVATVSDAHAELFLYSGGAKRKVNLIPHPLIEVIVQDSVWNPEFGVEQPRKVLSIPLRSPPLVTTLRWQ